MTSQVISSICLPLYTRFLNRIENSLLRDIIPESISTHHYRSVIREIEEVYAFIETQNIETDNFGVFMKRVFLFLISNLVLISLIIAQEVVETVTNHYNLQNRLETVTTVYGDTTEIAEYSYNDSGIR